MKAAELFTRAGTFIRINTYTLFISFNLGNYFFTRKIPCFRDYYNYVSCEALTEYDLFLALVMLDKTYAGNRFCWTKPMPGICYVEQNLFLAYVMLDKTYSLHRICSTKPIPGIRYVGQNHIWDLVVKVCKTTCFPSKKKK